ncbi:hypothetical protein O0L34_g18927 [Tuta absoluta]|nr:hypothetical protein O0L34_g18927 [Tuta absoluta]
MDGLPYFLILLICAASGKPMVEDGAEMPSSEQPAPTADTAPSAVTTSTTTTEAIDAAESPLNCSSARNKPGLCISRANCDYSTNAVDFTLYAPQGYIKICKMDEVCCPVEYVSLNRESSNVPPGSPSNNDKDFEFDDED